MKAAVATVLLLFLAGCGGTPGPTGMFADADHRWSGSSDEPFQESVTFVLPAGPHTLRIAAVSDQGFGISLAGPDAAGFGFTHSWHVDIGRLEYLIQDDLDGRWTLEYGCDGACSYAIAIDEGDHVPTTPAPAYADAATSFAAGSLDDGSDTVSFDVPPGNVTIRTHVQSDDGIEWVVRDAAGRSVTNWAFDKIHARDWRYGPSDPDPTPGTWQVSVFCDGLCSYNFGVIVTAA